MTKTPIYVGAAYCGGVLVNFTHFFLGLSRKVEFKFS